MTVCVVTGEPAPWYHYLLHWHRVYVYGEPGTVGEAWTCQSITGYRAVSIRPADGLAPIVLDYPDRWDLSTWLHLQRTPEALRMLAVDIAENIRWRRSPQRPGPQSVRARGR